MISVILPARFGDPWEEELARFTINTMRMQTMQAFELVIVEYHTDLLEDLADVHIRIGQGADLTWTEQWNQGAEASSGKYLVHTGIDVIVGPGWLENMLEPFKQDHQHLVGCTTLACTEPGCSIGGREPEKKIIEGMYGPLMMFDRAWRFDPAFPNVHSDSDLIMRMYDQGLRSYRNLATVCHHLNGVTWKSTTTHNERERQREKANDVFIAKWGNHPSWMAQMILRGHIVYGKEQG